MRTVHVGRRPVHPPVHRQPPAARRHGAKPHRLERRERPGAAHATRHPDRRAAHEALPADGDREPEGGRAEHRHDLRRRREPQGARPRTRARARPAKEALTGGGLGLQLDERAGVPLDAAGRRAGRPRLQARDAAGTRNGHRQRHLGVELPEPGGVLHVEPAADEAVVVVAPCVEQQVGERAGRGEGVEDVRRRVARMARAVGARMERAAGRHRAERVKELVRGDVRAGNPGARSEVDDGVRRARVRRAAALPTDVLLVRRPVVVHEVLRGIRVEGRPRELELQHSHPPLERRERRGRGREPDDGEVGLQSAGEREDVEARRPGRILRPPPGLDLRRVALDPRRELGAPVRAVAGKRVDHVDVRAGDRLGSILTGAGPAPGRPRVTRPATCRDDRHHGERREPLQPAGRVATPVRPHAPSPVVAS
jgi:hypothetical protein